MSIPASAPLRQLHLERASSDTKRSPAVQSDRNLPCRLLPTPQLHVACTPGPEGSGRCARNHTSNTLQAPNFIDVKLPNFIDNSIRSPSWPTGTATRKCPPSPAARQRKTWPSLPHCPACGDTPASAIRARSTRRAIIVNPVIMYPNRPSGRSRRIDTLGGALRQYVRTDAGGNPGRRFLHRISREMGVAGRRLDLAVTKQLADRRQALAQRQGT